MTKYCLTIVPLSNFPSEFSTSGKRHNKDYQEISAEVSQIPNGTSLNNNIHSPQVAVPTAKDYIHLKSEHNRSGDNQFIK